MSETLTYSDKAKGWTSFHPWRPGLMASLGNRFYTIKNGQLWLHNDQDNPVRNNFYGEQYSSKIKTVINEANADDKIFKNLIIEGTEPWDVIIKTNLTESTIKKEEFNTRESRHFAYIRKNENPNDHHGLATQGIGIISSVSGTTITFLMSPEMVNIGDKLYQLNGDQKEMIGEITGIDDGNLTIDIDTQEFLPVNGYFAFAQKSFRIEGSEIRGYYAEITLENDSTGPVELFAITSNIIKSYP